MQTFSFFVSFFFPFFFCFWRRLSIAIHNPMRVMEWSNRLRYFWFCIRSSARSDLLLVSHEALLTMQQRLLMIFFTFLLLNQEHGVNNERSQSIQSVRLSNEHTSPKRPSARRKKKKKKKFIAYSAQLAIRYMYNRSIPQGLILSQTSAF